jgi:hypothetical protein
MGCTGSTKGAEKPQKKITEELKKIFLEDLNLYLILPNEVQNKMILSNLEAGDRSIDYPKVIQELFDEANVSKNGRLNYEEWKTFSAALSFKMTQKYGDTYNLTEE